MAYIEYTNPETRVWLEIHNNSVVPHAFNTGRVGDAERVTTVTYSDETLLRFDISDLLFSTILDAALEFTANNQGTQSASQTMELFNQNKSNYVNWAPPIVPRYDTFAKSAWTSLLSTVTVQNTGTYTFPDTTAFKNLMQDWLDWGVDMNGLIMSIAWFAVNDYLSVDSVKLKMNYTPPINPVWGMKYVTLQGSGITNCRMEGEVSPDIDDMKIESMSFAVGANKSENVRLAVYTGGTLDNPAGATLLYDFGQISGSGTNKWYTITHPGGGVAWPKNTLTWLAWRANGGTTDLIFTGQSSRSGDTQSARGRWQSSSMSTSETTSFESIIPSGGSFSDFWTPIVVQYSSPALTASLVDKSVLRGVNRGVYRGIL